MEATKDVEFNANTQSYQEYCKLYFTNIILSNQVKMMLSEKNELSGKIKRYESTYRPVDNKTESHWGDNTNNRHRRAATEISRHYRCPVQSCTKSYGSEGSLNQHVKLKHPQVYYEPAKPEPNI